MKIDAGPPCDNIKDRSPEWPCTACGSRTKNDSRTTDGLVFCRGLTGPFRPGQIVNGHYYLGQTDDGVWGMFRAIDRPPPRRRKAAAAARDKAEPPRPGPAQLTDEQAGFRDRVYRHLLGDINLTAKHQEDLGKRGLTAAEIQTRAYRSVPDFRTRCAVGRELRREFGDVVFDVPGVWLMESRTKPGTTYPLVYPAGGKGSVTGIVIPVMDRLGRVVALRVRVDREHEDGGKCRWFRRRGDARPATFVHYGWPWNPSGEPDRRVPQVIVTEGELKAGITAFRTGILTLSIPGVDSWRRTEPELVYLKTRGLHAVLLALDQDARPNQQVFGAGMNLFDLANDLGLSVSVIRWGVQRHG